MSSNKSNGLFEQFHQLHAGKTLLVCGCGNSLRQLKTQPRLVSIGVNDVGRLFNPTYLLVANRPGDFKNDRYDSVYSSHAQAVFSPYLLPLAKAPLVPFQLTQRSGTDFNDINGLPYTRNSPYIALCLAAFMGASRIGILGVDFTQNHFFAASGHHPLTRELGEIDAEYSRLRQAMLAHNIEVVNLSEESRLRAFPKQSLVDFLANSADEKWGSPRALPLPAVRRVAPPRRLDMRISIEKHGSGLQGAFFDTLATSLKSGGARVRRIRARSSDHDPVTFVWNGRATQPPGAAIYCEHGWLPRWHFQMSPLGINAHSHCAPFHFDGREATSGNRELVSQYLAQLRGLGPNGYMAPHASASKGLPKAFLLVPLQIEQDTNICRHVPKALRGMQKFIDYVSWHQPNLPLLFKQHPADARQHNQHLRLKVRRSCDALIPHRRGNIHQILKTGACKGIIALNSNAVHDGLIWDVPAAVLGRNIWPRQGMSPFLRHVPQDWRELDHHFQTTQSCREAYCLHLIRNQWSLEDVANPEKLVNFIRQCPSFFEQVSA